jgi:TPR repeat protein
MRALAFLIGLAALPALAETPAQRCLARQGAEERRDCEAAVAAAPADPALRRAYAFSLIKAGYFELALREYFEVTRLTPAAGHAHYEYAATLAFLRRWPEAVAPIERAMRLAPDHAASFRVAAIVYSVLKRPDDMVRALEGGARAGDSIAMYDLSYSYETGRGAARDLAAAVAWLERAGAAGHVLAMDRLAEIYLQGLLGQRVDLKKAEYWATEARKARNEGKL